MTNDEDPQQMTEDVLKSLEDDLEALHCPRDYR